jgi:hypothetical protein
VRGGVPASDDPSFGINQTSAQEKPRLAKLRSRTGLPSESSKLSGLTQIRPKWTGAMARSWILMVSIPTCRKNFGALDGSTSLVVLAETRGSASMTSRTKPARGCGGHLVTGPLCQAASRT